MAISALRTQLRFLENVTVCKQCRKGRLILYEIVLCETRDAARGGTTVAKSAREHLNAKKHEKLVVLEKDFAGIKAGNTMFVATPQIVDDYIRSIPKGESRTIVRMRNELARQWNANATCPVSSAIFLRISAQAAIDDMEDGKPVTEVTPFWRVISSKDKVAKKLSIDSQWIDIQREAEGI